MKLGVDEKIEIAVVIATGVTYILVAALLVLCGLLMLLLGTIKHNDLQYTDYWTCVIMILIAIATTSLIIAIDKRWITGRRSRI